ncbi:MAG: class I SAM-dependent methyltransferase [Gemmatimonadetes bacterium]|nr:class I SAM-dependent methyltransferase [Gemmatimonadota bacterium]MBT6147798.1 class I SAM-dependent methyltransferase [Gemmatimonadota bacterium]MBT7859159.1 class I SAM-dependent methyltransferase [Gemmatimonadota bacterium]
MTTIADEGSPPEHEYDGPLARYYDAYFTGLEGEDSFYRDLAIQSRGPVLELGCGSGRTLIPVAAAGIEITGLERSAAMLDLARKRLPSLPAPTQQKIDLCLGDMCQFELETKFALINLPYRTFQHLLSVDAQHQALECICRHLAPGGRIALNVFDPTLDLARLLMSPDAPEPLADGEFTDVQGQRVCARYVRGYDPERQWMIQHFWFDEMVGEQITETRQARLTLRYAYRYEMEHLLQHHGLQVESLAGGFDGEAYEGWGEQVWIASAP